MVTFRFGTRLNHLRSTATWEDFTSELKPNPGTATSSLSDPRKVSGDGAFQSSTATAKRLSWGISMNVSVLGHSVPIKKSSQPCHKRSVSRHSEAVRTGQARPYPPGLSPGSQGDSSAGLKAVAPCLHGFMSLHVSLPLRQCPPL
jgi:hypothetical protein